MINKENEVKMYMDIAERIAKESKAVRMKAGAVLVKDERIISMGWNGTARGRDNCCEYTDEDTGKLVTKPEVLHAEQNILAKLASSTESARGATLFVTHGTCIICSKMLAKAGIEQVYFGGVYRSCEGLDYLMDMNVTVYHYSPDHYPLKGEGHALQFPPTSDGCYLLNSWWDTQNVGRATAFFACKTDIHKDCLHLPTE